MLDLFVKSIIREITISIQKLPFLQYSIVIDGTQDIEAGLKVLQHRAGFLACSVWMWKKNGPIFEERCFAITVEFTSSSANYMRGTQLFRSQTNIISQSEIERSGSWKMCFNRVLCCIDV